MSRDEETRLERCARRLGLDRNPLRRRMDRIEAAIRLATMILLLVAVPIAAIVGGRRADHLALRQAHAQAAADHQVTAILLQQATATGPLIRTPRFR
jgi:DNA polymerase III epsilon subunit-like protein